MTSAELQDWRYRAGLSQPGLAALLGVHWLTISKWETGQHGIPAYLHLALWAIEHGAADKLIAQNT